MLKTYGHRSCPKPVSVQVPVSNGLSPRTRLPSAGLGYPSSPTGTAAHARGMRGDGSLGASSTAIPACHGSPLEQCLGLSRPLSRRPWLHLENRLTPLRRWNVGPEIEKFATDRTDTAVAYTKKWAAKSGFAEGHTGRQAVIGHS